jgi:hypothetical protein
MLSREITLPMDDLKRVTHHDVFSVRSPEEHRN